MKQRNFGRWIKSKIPLPTSTITGSETATPDTNTDKSQNIIGYQYYNFKFANRYVLAPIGIILAFGLLYSIAMIDETVTIASWDDATESVEIAYQNTYDAIAPLGISDVAAVIIGESTAAIVAALAGSLILLTMKFQEVFPQSASKSSSDFVPDGDFLVAKAASISLLTSIGVPPSLAKVSSILLASLSYGIVKLGISRRDQIVEENVMLNELLTEQQKKTETERIQNGFVMSSMSGVSSWTSSSSTLISSAVADTERFVPVQEEKEPVLDSVEVFSDITKWLQYDVLCSKFGEKLLWHDQPLLPGFEAAIFGAVSCLSAQVYCDILRAYFNLGGSVAREKVLTRTFSEMISLYTSQILYGAALFVTYEAVQIPAQWILNALLSGGVDNCIGSPDYSGCVETFIELNPLDESPEEEIYSRISPFVDSVKYYMLSKGVPVG